MSWNVEIIADSVNPAGSRLTTFVCTYPRIIHSELLTHRAFSRNAASSRAIPIEKMIKAVEDHPAKPIRWGTNGKGMQDHGVAPAHHERAAASIWHGAAQRACNVAHSLNVLNIHKQIANRVLEPFMWMTTIISATEWANFFRLRVHPAAQPEFQHLALMMLKHYVYVDPDGPNQIRRKPRPLDWGQWHLPFVCQQRFSKSDNRTQNDMLAMSVAHCARVSYTKHEASLTTEDAWRIHDQLLNNRPMHASPFEHQAQAVNVPVPVKLSNFHQSWFQYRSLIENNPEYAAPEFDAEQHLTEYLAGQADA